MESVIESDGPVKGALSREDYNDSGELKTKNADLTLVVGCAEKSEQYIANKQ